MCLTLAIKALATSHGCCYRVETIDGEPVQNTGRIQRLLNKTQRRPAAVVLLGVLCSLCWVCSFLGMFLMSTVFAPYVSKTSQNVASLIFLIPGLCGVCIFVMGFIEYRVMKRKDSREMQDMITMVEYGHDEDTRSLQ